MSLRLVLEAATQQSELAVTASKFVVSEAEPRAPSPYGRRPRLERSRLGVCRSGLLQYASNSLALCDVRTLYLRNVPDDVVERLERLAARDATSVAAVAVRELAEVSRRADNPALLGSLPDLGLDTAAIVSDVDAGRAER
jgi:hypothetical protein